MKWTMTSRAAKAAAITLMFALCGAACGTDAATQINRKVEEEAHTLAAGS